MPIGSIKALKSTNTALNANCETGFIYGYGTKTGSLVLGGLAKGKYAHNKALAAADKLKASGADSSAMAKAFCAINMPIGSIKALITLNRALNGNCETGFTQGYTAVNW